MQATTIAMDLAKESFELAFANADHRIILRKRLTRRALGRTGKSHSGRVVMEACSGALTPRPNTRLQPTKLAPKLPEPRQ